MTATVEFYDRQLSNEMVNIFDQLIAQGIEAGDFEDRYGAEGMGRSIYIEDPEGNTVELRSRLVDG